MTNAEDAVTVTSTKVAFITPAVIVNAAPVAADS